MRSYLSCTALSCTAFHITVLLVAQAPDTMAAPATKQWNFPAAVKKKDADLATLPDSLPVDEEDAPAPKASPRPRAAAPQSREPTPALPGNDLDETPAFGEPAAPVPTVKNSTTSPAGPSAADDMAPEQSVDIPLLPEEPTATADASAPADEMTLDGGPIAEIPEDTLPENPPTEAPAAPSRTLERTREASIISRRRLGSLYRPYYDEKPQYAFQFSGSPQALGERFEFGGGDNAQFNVRGFTAAFEIQPKFLQHVGVFSFGPTFTFYPFSITDPQSASENATDKPFDVHAFGASVKYQAHWIRGQPIVPYVGYEWQFAKYKFLPDPTPGAVNRGLNGTTTLSGFTFGAMLQLQWLEHEAAFEAYQEWGMKRSYLLFEGKKLTSAEGVLDTVGNSYWFGLRLEI